MYSKACLKPPLIKKIKIGFQNQLLLNAGQKYCRMLQGEHSAILLTFIKLPFVNKIFVLSKTGFTVHVIPYITFCGCSVAATSTEPGEFIVFVALCQGAPEGSTGSGSGLRCLSRQRQGLKSHLTDLWSQELNLAPLGTRQVTYPLHHAGSCYRTSTIFGKKQYFSYELTAV